MTIDTLTDDYGIPQRHRWLGEEKKSHYIPGWYRPHQDLSVRVTHRGVDQGMTVKDVLPYRRWAIDQEGETLPQADFEQLYLRYLDGCGAPETAQLQCEAIPNVRAFVRAKPDHNGNLVDFAFKDDGRVVKTEKFTQDGGVAPEFLARQQENAEQSGALRLLSKLVREGKLAPEDFAAQAEKLLGDKPEPAAPRSEELEKAEAAAEALAEEEKLAKKRAAMAHAREVAKKRKEAAEQAAQMGGEPEDAA